MVKTKNFIKKILKSNIAFWFIMFVSIAQILIFIKDKSYNCLLIFIVSAFVLKKLSNNIPLSLFTSLLISNFIFGCKKVKEGLDNKEDLKGLIQMVQSGKVNTQGLQNVKNMTDQFNQLKKGGGADMGLDMGSLNQLLNFNSKISSSNLTSKDDVKKAVNHLRANKELLKKMIDKF